MEKITRKPDETVNLLYLDEITDKNGKTVTRLRQKFVTVENAQKFLTEMNETEGDK